MQACRYCGLLEASAAAFEAARRLDAQVRTSAAHAFLAMGDYNSAIEHDIENPPILKAYGLAGLGRHAEAAALLRSAAVEELPQLYRFYVEGLRCVFEGNHEAARALFESLTSTWTMRDPCGWYYAARVMAHLGAAAPALQFLEHSITGGFACFPWFVRDPWLDSIRGRSGFRVLMAEAEARHRHAADTFAAAGGPGLLGVREPT